MKINWLVRFKNKTWLLSFLGVVIAFVYNLLGLFGVVPSITQDTVSQLVVTIVNVLVGLGVVIDPTTAGIEDSQQAMNYTEPKK